MTPMLPPVLLRALVIGVVCASCSMPMAPVDAGTPPPPVDAGAPVACTKPESCRDEGLTSSVCRAGFCSDDVPCGTDFECSLGERCLRGRCAFTGCTKDRDCPTGRCLGDTYSCVECSISADCPRDRPVCNAATNSCQACQRDEQCTPPGPGRCSAAGACVHCLVNDDCPNGLTCSGSMCVGAKKNDPCPEGTQCGAGLSCVNLNMQRVCLPSCNLYQPRCEATELCYRLTYDTSNSLVFESDGPIGVCFRQQTGFKGPRELCQRNGMGGSNCQPNLQCVPETASTAQCRTYCNPLVSGGCVGAEKCVAFTGDFGGRRYGLCLPDTGFGERCTRDTQCRGTLSCQPYDDPSVFNNLSNICQFSPGTGLGLSPCAPRVTDAGVLPADLSCKSGACRGDPSSLISPNYFCYAACEQDSDCSIGGRTGVCDSDFSFTTAFGASGTVRGCRPSCAGAADCNAYDAGVVCTPRITVPTSTTANLIATCAPRVGTTPAFGACSASSECASGFCQLDDARGVRRNGVCLEPCTTADRCSTVDAGVSLPLSCTPVSLLGTRGIDGVANTPDDVVVRGTFCAGPSCRTSEDCATDAGVDTVCAPMFDQQGASPLTLRCVPRTAFLRGGGQSCVSDVECQSGVCGTVQAPSTGSGRACFEACLTGSTCSVGGMSCRIGGLSVATARGAVSVDSCAP